MSQKLFRPEPLTCQDTAKHETLPCGSNQDMCDGLIVTNDAESELHATDLRVTGLERSQAR